MEREVSIDCPLDCVYLAAAHRYEDQHQREVPADTPFLEQRLPQETIHTHQYLMNALAFALVKACLALPSATDPDVLAALRAEAETYQTLVRGIYYETVPDLPVQKELYGAITAFLEEARQKQAGGPAVKAQDIFYILVFLYRMGLLRGNGRPRSRRFIEFLRSQFPQSGEAKPEQPRIIVP
jgi:hypothetical protein